MTRASQILVLALPLLAGCQDDPTERRASLEEIAAYLEQAYSRFDQRDFDGCISCCTLLLDRAPDCVVAQELAEDAEKMKRRELKVTYVRNLAEHLTHAYEHFRRREFEACLDLCSYITRLEPEYCVSIELAEDVAKVREQEEYFDFLMA